MADESPSSMSDAAFLFNDYLSKLIEQEELEIGGDSRTLISFLALEFAAARGEDFVNQARLLAEDTGKSAEQIFQKRAREIAADLARLTVKNTMADDRDIVRVGDFLVALSKENEWGTYPVS